MWNVMFSLHDHFVSLVAASQRVLITLAIDLYNLGSLGGIIFNFLIFLRIGRSFREAYTKGIEHCRSYYVPETWKTTKGDLNHTSLMPLISKHFDTLNTLLLQRHEGKKQIKDHQFGFRSHFTLDQFRKITDQKIFEEKEICSALFFDIAYDSLT